ncbi:hypothetical protein D8Y22_06045 [Salinadaptatus halalkaliphilus]|uniref:Origin-associated protein OapC n=1 Tax=Salinadaptatus halalkaliphilus TaxID=2419781 RepID=A0A4S3TSV7_9EURY|nr:Zn-ribbon containing protein [Salinadaptatus halalkaliphilus]THE65728.1 hypothetical protein D8Y22_06045 [Salinadaptatus halalkaliphilus]
MPHECTNCGRTFPDGSKEMLSGCPDCGGNKFQFTPSRSTSQDPAEGSESQGGGDTAPVASAADAPDEDPAGDETSGWDSESGFTKATETVRNWVTSDDGRDGERATAADSGTALGEAGTASADTDPTSADTDPISADTDTTSADTDPTSADTETAPEGLETAGANADAESASAWPASETGEGGGSTDEPSEFGEWPDTARRPEDRSSAPDQPSDRSSGDDASNRSSGASGRDQLDSSAESAPSKPPITETEDSAQADARGGVVSNDDIPAGTVEGTTGTDQPAVDDEQAPDHGRVVSEPSGDQPSIEELRAELNEQFESIKIVNPGQYELNLMELYNREEYIISLQEDGRYVIDVPDSWRDGDTEE